MKKIKCLFLCLLILTIIISSFPSKKVKAANTTSDLMYVGQDWDYTFMRIGTIQKVTYSNKKVVSATHFSGDMIFLKAKSPGTTTITVKGTAYTYTIKLIIKKMDVTATFCRILPNGNYLVKVTNNTKEGFFDSVTYITAIRSSSGEFLDWDDDFTVGGLIPGATVYSVYRPMEDYDIDLSKSTLEVSEFETELTTSGYKYIDCTSKIKIIDAKGGAIAPTDSKVMLKFKNNSSYVVTAYANIYWYDENGEIVQVDNKIIGDFNLKKVYELTVKTPKEDCGAVSYSVTVNAYNKSK